MRRICSQEGLHSHSCHTQDHHFPTLCEEQPQIINCSQRNWLEANQLVLEESELTQREENCHKSAKPSTLGTTIIKSLPKLWARLHINNQGLKRVTTTPPSPPRRGPPPATPQLIHPKMRMNNIVGPLQLVVC